jgi:hypothetical protein
MMRSKKQPEPATFESAMNRAQKNAKAIQTKRDNARALKEMDESIKAMKKEFWESVKAMQKEIGGITKSNGEVAESYFINSFSKRLLFAGQKYDSFIPNLRKKSKILNLEGEYDLVLYNCTSVVIIEIKYKARKEDIEPLLNKTQTFKQLFPEYANYDIFLGLAGLHVNITAEKEAIKQGVAIIKQVGKNMVINDGHLKVF